MENVLAKMGIIGKNMGNGLFAENHDLLENTYKHMIFIGKIIVFIWQKLGILCMGHKRNHKKAITKFMISFWEIEVMMIQEKTKNMRFDVVGVPIFLLRSGEVIIPGCVQASSCWTWP